MAVCKVPVGRRREGPGLLAMTLSQPLVSPQSGTSWPLTPSSSPSTWWKLCSRSLVWASTIFMIPGTFWVCRNGVCVCVCVPLNCLRQAENKRAGQGVAVWEGCGSGLGTWAGACYTQAPCAFRLLHRGHGCAGVHTRAVQLPLLPAHHLQPKLLQDLQGLQEPAGPEGHSSAEEAQVS